MSDSHNPFDSIESAQEFMGLLSDAIEEAIRDVSEDRTTSQADGQERQVEALSLALYKLKLLDQHVDQSRRILKDLRSIRRILVGEHPDLEEDDENSEETPPETSARFGI